MARNLRGEMKEKTKLENKKCPICASSEIEYLLNSKGKIKRDGVTSRVHIKCRSCGYEGTTPIPKPWNYINYLVIALIIIFRVFFVAKGLISPLSITILFVALGGLESNVRVFLKKRKYKEIPQTSKDGKEVDNG